MKVSLACSPSYAIAYCKLALGETLLVEAGGMVAMSGGVSLSASTGGGALKGAMRKMLGGETFFLGRYTADTEGAWVAVAPRNPGDIAELPLDGKVDVITEQGAYLASTAGLNMSVVAGNTTSMMNREGLTLLRHRGVGTLLICSYGGLQTFSLDDGQSVIVDTGHLVGYTSTVTPTIGPVGSIIASAAAGEGFAAKLTGPGMVWMQTRADHGDGWFTPRRKQN